MQCLFQRFFYPFVFTFAAVLGCVAPISSFAARPELTKQITFNVSGKNGREGINGFDGIEGRDCKAFPRFSHKPAENGGNGGNAKPASAGQNAGRIDIQVSRGDQPNTMKLLGSMKLISGKEQTIDRTIDLTQLVRVILIASGGNGGAGAKGGSGGDGGKGQFYVPLGSRIPDSWGEEGYRPAGSGGNAGNGSPGEDGGSGGQINIIIHPSDIDLLRFFAVQASAGSGGAAGEHGNPGLAGKCWSSFESLEADSNQNVKNGTAPHSYLRMGSSGLAGRLDVHSPSGEQLFSSYGSVLDNEVPQPLYDLNLQRYEFSGSNTVDINSFEPQSLVTIKRIRLKNAGLLPFKKGDSLGIQIHDKFKVIEPTNASKSAYALPIDLPAGREIELDVNVEGVLTQSSYQFGLAAEQRQFELVASLHGVKTSRQVNVDVQRAITDLKVDVLMLTSAEATPAQIQEYEALLRGLGISVESIIDTDSNAAIDELNPALVIFFGKKNPFSPRKNYPGFVSFHEISVNPEVFSKKSIEHIVKEVIESLPTPLKLSVLAKIFDRASNPSVAQSAYRLKDGLTVRIDSSSELARLALLALAEALEIKGTLEETPSELGLLYSLTNYLQKASPETLAALSNDFAKVTALLEYFTVQKQKEKWRHRWLVENKDPKLKAIVATAIGLSNLSRDIHLQHRAFVNSFDKCKLALTPSQ